METVQITYNRIMKEDNNVEYWVYEASKGRNVAECWQAIHKLMEEEKKEIGEQAIRMVGEDMGWEDSTEHYIKNWKNLTK